MRRSLVALRKLAELLKCGPRSLHLCQLLQVDYALSVVEADKVYSHALIHQVLVGGQHSSLAAGDGRLINGQRLTEELVALAEELSEGAQLSAETWPEPLSSVADVARRLHVGAKTVCRWRRRGLVAWRFRGPNARKRLMFPEHCVRRFVGRNLALVSRAASFTLVSEAERQQIVARATELAKRGQRTLNALSRRIAPEVDRAVATIRQILKHHDDEHAHALTLGRCRSQVVLPDQNVAIWEAHAGGVTAEVLARRFQRPIAEILTTITQMRAQKLRTQEIAFIRSPEFEAPGAEERILNPVLHGPLRKSLTPAANRPSRTLPSYLAGLFRIPLLTREGERVLFRKMNYFKYKAHALAQRLDPLTAMPPALDRIEKLLDRAAHLRNEIAQANLRLVVSIAKKRRTAGQDLFELISDGNVVLLRAVEKFDYTRGFRFSTYATWAIVNGYTRSLSERRRHLCWQSNPDDLRNAADTRPTEETQARRLHVVRSAVDDMLALLGVREQAILRGRYGLDEHGQPQSLEEVGHRLGLSRERVRQLQAKAVLTLRARCTADAVQPRGA
jgi:RNA polymerase primary sigma factor